jgi:hypothetical protein
MVDPRNTLPKVRMTTAIETSGQCACCKRTATLSIGIGKGIMAGGIKDYMVCGIHYDMARQNMAKFLAHMATKGTYTKERQVRGGNAIHDIQKHTWK